MGQKIRFLTLLLIPLSFYIELRAQPRSNLLLVSTNRNGSVTQTRDPAVRRSRNVIVNTQFLSSQNNFRLVLPLFDRRTIVLLREKIENTTRGFVWQGKIHREKDSIVYFSVVRNIVSAKIITQSGNQYEVQYIGNGVHVLNEIDRSKFSPESEPIPGSRSIPSEKNVVNKLSFKKNQTKKKAIGNTINVLVVYTSLAVNDLADSPEAVEAEIGGIIAEANKAFKDSGITATLKLAASLKKIEYSEDVKIITTLTKMQSSETVILNVIPAWREEYKADSVVLIIKGTPTMLSGATACAPGDEVPYDCLKNTKENAYSVVLAKGARRNYSFVHELGHQFGANHDCAYCQLPDSKEPKTGGNHGYVNDAKTWSTIMAYPNQCKDGNGACIAPSGKPELGCCPRINRFSNPGKMYKAKKTGTSQSDAVNDCYADNAKTINSNASKVASYY